MISIALTLLAATVIGTFGLVVLHTCNRWEMSSRAVVGWAMTLYAGYAVDAALRQPTTMQLAASVYAALVCIYVWRLDPKNRRTVLTLIGLERT